MFNTKIQKFNDSYRIRFYENVYFDHNSKDSAILDDSVIDEEFKRAESIRCSVSRTRNKIQIITSSFDGWAYFATFTFDKNKVSDRYSYKDCSSCMHEFLSDLKKSYPDVVYIVVPELHKDGAIHFHGVFSHDIPLTYVGKFRLKKGRPPEDTYHFNGFNYGFTTVTKVRSLDAVTVYISKYITKAITVISKNKKRYWYSHSKIKINKSSDCLCNREQFDDFFEVVEDYIFSYGKVKTYGKGAYRFKQAYIKKEHINLFTDNIVLRYDWSSS